MSPSGKIVIFTANLTHSVRRGIVEIDKAIPGLSWLILIHAPHKTPAVLLRNQWRNFVRNGWRWIPYLAGDIFRRVFSRTAHVEPSVPGSEFSAAALELRPNF